MEMLADYMDTLLRSMADPAFLLDREGRVRHANPSAHTVFSAIRLGSALRSLARVLDWDEGVECFHACMEQGRPLFRLLRSEEGRPVFEVTLTPLPRAPSGLREGAILSVCNVAGETLQEERRNALERVFHGIAEGVLILDPTGRVTGMNRSAELLLDAGEERLRRRPFTDGVRFDRVEDRIRVEEALAEGRSTAFDTVLRTQNKGLLHCSLSLSRLDETPGAGGSFALILADRTERVRMEKRFLQVERLNALGQFVAGFAHELNNPLATVVGFAQLLASRVKDDETLREDLEVLRRHAVRCKEIVDKLLAFAREREPERRTVDLNETVRFVRDLLHHPLEREGIRLETNLHPSLSSVYAEEAQLQQVLVNLMENARYALTTEKRGGTITISTLEREETVVVRVEDDGPGIPEAVLDRIMEPFFTTKPPGRGTGLGLSLSHGMVKQNGGRLLAANRPDGGALFEVILPVGTAPLEKGEGGREKP